MNYSKLENAYEFFENSVNIDNNPLQICGTDPMTGFYRNGYCKTGPDDAGTHTVCAKMTNEFLEFTKSMGNDLSTPTSYFPGLKEGDNWCLCAIRWEQAKKAGKAPKVIANATNKKSYNIIPKIERKYTL
tara:strand:+ start:3310 stop:3699 length:390 start_codon:yes stop_codon:yes gene_type:complete